MQKHGNTVMIKKSLEGNTACTQLWQTARGDEDQERFGGWRWEQEYMLFPAEPNKACEGGRLYPIPSRYEMSYR